MNIAWPQVAIAHSRNDQGHRHDLRDHLLAVARDAGEFAEAFGARNLGNALGLWHDIGKLNPAFQDFLKDCERTPSRPIRGPDHKGAGAIIARELGEDLLSWIVGGHHGGLMSKTDFKKWLQKPTADPAVRVAIETARQQIPEIGAIDVTTWPAIADDAVWTWELFVRMLFSTLVDADALDTEAHFSLRKATARKSSAGLPALLARLELSQHLVATQGSEVIRSMRQAVYEDCVRAADEGTGLFRLAAPTGAGKTRSGMAFALRHAIAHGLRRVIIAVPLTTITQQTASTYRSIFEIDADPVVLEHHSGSTHSSDDDHSVRAAWSRLAAENWDAPIVVTTTVQLFESLFSNAPSKTRKVHRLAKSVIILDEAQTLPAKLLEPILSALRDLCTTFGSTVVLSTATQPSFETISAFADLPARDIVPGTRSAGANHRRVAFDWRSDPQSWEEIAAEIASLPQVLAIVNTKSDALSLLDLVPGESTLHLSTLLCGAHRSDVLQEVKARLDSHSPCRLIATQVVEAGVDLDFPVVFRAFGPFDSIIQAAGRCNREGHLDMGHVIVFEPIGGGMPPGQYKAATNVTRTILHDGVPDIDDPIVARRYYTDLFKRVSLDGPGIQEMRKRFDYPAVRDAFRMIDDDTQSVAVYYGSDETQANTRRLLEELRIGHPKARQIWRQLQPYLVNVRARPLREYLRLGLVSQVAEGLFEWLGSYDAIRGLVADRLDTDQLIV